jgi:hypothetical protein
MGVNVAFFSKNEVGGDFNTCSGGVSPSSLNSDSYVYTDHIKIRSAQNINANNYENTALDRRVVDKLIV